MDQIGTDGEGRYSLDAFVHFMKGYQNSPMQHSHHQSNTYYDQESFTRPTSPIHRPSSASKVSRQGVYSSASSGHHHTRISSRYPVSPVAAGVYNDQDNTFTPDAHHLSKRRHEMTRTPDVSFITVAGPTRLTKSSLFSLHGSKQINFVHVIDSVGIWIVVHACDTCTCICICIVSVRDIVHCTSLWNKCS